MQIARVHYRQNTQDFYYKEVRCQNKVLKHNPWHYSTLHNLLCISAAVSRCLVMSKAAKKGHMAMGLCFTTQVKNSIVL